MEELQGLINRRKYVRRRVTEIFNDKENFHTYLPIRIQENINLLNSYSSDLSDLDDDIRDKTLEVEKKACTEDEYFKSEGYKDKINICMTWLNSLKVETRSSNDDHNRSDGRSVLRCPTAPLPKFTSAEGEDLTRFFTEFEDATGKYNYTEYDKLLLLKQQLSGRALVLVNSLEADKQGYSEAKSLLTTALASREIQIFSSIKQLTELKLTAKTDPFEYISKVRLISESVKKLNITVQNVLQYFIWFGLNETFQEQLISLNNTIRPSYDEIILNFFDAAERYSHVAKKLKSHNDPQFKLDSNKFDVVPEKMSAFAANVNYGGKKQFNPKPLKFRQCVLCGDDKTPSHPIYKCERFPDGKSKVSRLLELKGCVKCGYTNHQAPDCRYKFSSKCRFCRKWHQGFLCSVSSTSESPKDKQTVNTSTVVISDVFSDTMDSNCILLTF